MSSTDNYDKHKEEVARRLEKKLSEYSSNHTPLKFIGYYLPDISFQSKEFTEALYFGDATFYGLANFSGAKFSNETYFSGATFSDVVGFNRAYFAEKVSFLNTWFDGEVYFLAVDFKKLADFVYCKFNKSTLLMAALKRTFEKKFRS
jgi:uncharacterized protein YjbI with pentapeptide repeats